MTDKRKKKILVEYGLHGATKQELFLALASILKTFEDPSNLKQVYSSGNIRKLELSSAILVRLQGDGDWLIAPSTRKQLAEPRFRLTADVVSNPGYFSWITVLRMAEAWISVQFGAELGDENDIPVIPAGASDAQADMITQGVISSHEESLHGIPSPPVVEVSDLESFQSETHAAVHDLQVGDSLACYDKEDAVVDNRISGAPPDWLSYLNSYNRYSPKLPGNPEPWLMESLSGRGPTGAIDCDPSKVFARISETRLCPVYKELRTLSRFYGCPAIEGKGFTLSFGRAKVKVTWFCRVSTLISYDDRCFNDYPDDVDIPPPLD